MLQKLIIARHLVGIYGATATLYSASVWAKQRFRHIVYKTPLTWRKFHLMNELAYINGYRSILEISTAGSGFTYDQLDRSRFDVRRRISYLTPNDWTDGSPVDYRCCDRDTSEIMRQIRAKGLRFDIVFVDACHEYESTRRDMQDALSLLRENGIIVMHDCAPNPEWEAYCTPTHRNLDAWYGVTYKAYLDFLLEHNDLWYCTVDADTGCGMIRSNRKPCLYKRAIDVNRTCIRAWQNANDYKSAFRLYEQNRNVLMNIVTVGEFLAAEWKNRKAKTKVYKKWAMK